MRVPILILVLSTSVAHADELSAVRHVPPAEATGGQPLELDAQVARAWESTLTLHYRTIGEAAWIDAAFARSDDTWIATVPGEQVVTPGVEYFIDSVAEGAARAEFASADHPHRVPLVRTPSERRRDRDLARVQKKRSRIHVAAEYVPYGTRTIGDFGRISDSYYRVDADWAYRLLAYPLKQFRFGYTRVLGDVPDTELDDPAMCVSATCRRHVGFKVGGWIELRFGLTDGVDLDARLMAMATEEAVGLGGRAELRFGLEDGNHVAVGAEAIQDTGTSAHFRLGWATVPQLPMAATVEVTDMPSSLRAAGVRFLYDIAHPLPNGVRVGVRVGYQGRDSDVGGISGGGNLSVDF